MTTELIEFWASGCKQSLPCHRAVERLMAVNELDMAIRSIDAWDAPLDVVAYRIIQLPSLLLIVDGVESARCSPARPTPESITSWVVSHLGQELHAPISALSTA